VTYPDSFALEEAKGLVDSADRTCVAVFTQKYLNHSQYGMGAGKAEEVKKAVQESGAQQVIVDEHLTSKQTYNLEKLTGVQVIDRERLILDIFYSRATTTEAKLQIELAEIKYEMPRVRENAKLTSGGERAGKGGMGEYTVDVKFRDLKRTGAILDALVAEGANQISGPNLTIDKPESALDEARMRAIANGRARADLYARALGMRVVRLLSVSEGGGHYMPPPMPVAMMAEARGADASSKIDPGTQQLQVNVAMSFELQ